MPKERIYTDAGYIEISWMKDGQLVCVESGELIADPPGVSQRYQTTMHQFTRADEEALTHLAALLRRAKRQSIERPAHRLPCVDGSVCGEPAHCPPA